MNTSRPAVFWDPTFGIWCSPNVSSLHGSVPSFDMDVRSTFRFRDFRHARWLSNTFPYLAFWPVQPSFDGQLFRRLDITDESLKIVTINAEKYILDTDTIASWERLEFALLDLSMFLIGQKFEGRRCELGLLPLPKDCGYNVAHRSPEFVRRCAHKSRDAFVCLATLCSFAIALNSTSMDMESHAPTWFIACQLRGVNLQWLTDLRKSFVCRFAPGFRVGAYVSAYHSTWAPWFSAFEKASVPLWIWWGHEGRDPIEHSAMPKLKPTWREVEAAKERASILPGRHFEPQVQPHIEQLSMHVDAGPVDIEPVTLPEPFPGSRQHKGETLRQFIERMDEEKRLGLKVAESREEMFTRIAKEKIAEKEYKDNQIEEPSVGEAMYEWVRQPGGHLLRKFVPRPEWKARWRHFNELCRRYHSFLDEWDLEVYETDGGLYGDESDYGSESDEDETHQPTAPFSFGTTQHLSSKAPPEVQPTHPATTVIQPQPLVVPPGGPNHYTEDVYHLYGNKVPDSQAEASSIRDILHHRYGFMAMDPYVASIRIRPSERVPANTEHVLSAMSRVGLKTYMGSHLDQAVVDLYNFVVSYGSRPFAFAPLWDFHPDVLRSITQHTKFQYCRIDHDLHIIGITGSPLTSQWYVLVVRDACSILHIFREVPTSLLSFARSLLRHGIPFATARCLSREPSLPTSRINVGLGHRPSKHRFDLTEYAAYEQAKRDILAGSFGRVALLRGGILWRLAKDVVAVKAVTRGPTSSCKTQGVVVGRFDNHVLVDDTLSNEDEDIICGVYHVYTGYVLFILFHADILSWRTGNGEQTGQLSWWPKSNTWAHCGLNVGYWSVDCEAWYQKRLEEIRGGSAKLLNASEWRERLKLKAAHTASFVQGMSLLSDTLLSGDRRHWRWD